MQNVQRKGIRRKRKLLPPPSLASVLRRRLDIVRAEILRCGPLPDDEMIHDLRVAIRRSGEVIRIMQQAGFMGRQKAQRIMRVFRKVRRFAGDIRDLDVERDYLRKSKHPHMRPKTVYQILQTVADRRHKLATNLHMMLSQAHGVKTFTPLMRTLENVRFEADESILKKELFRRIQKNAKRLTIACDVALEKQTPLLIHQARIAGKRLRYAFELAHDARFMDCQKHITELKKFQKTAGNLHDVEFIFENISQYAAPNETTTRKKTGQKKQQGTLEMQWDNKIHGRIRQFQGKSLTALRRIRNLYGTAEKPSK